MTLARLNDLISFHQFSLLVIAVTIIFIFNSSTSQDLFINHLVHKKWYKTETGKQQIVTLDKLDINLSINHKNSDNACQNFPQPEVFNWQIVLVVQTELAILFSYVYFLTSIGIYCEINHDNCTDKSWYFNILCVLFLKLQWFSIGACKEICIWKGVHVKLIFNSYDPANSK